MTKIPTILPSLFAFAILFIVIGAIRAAFGGSPHVEHSIAFFFFLAAELLGITAFVIFDERHWSVVVSVVLITLFLIAMIVKPFL